MLGKNSSKYHYYIISEKMTAPKTPSKTKARHASGLKAKLKPYEIVGITETRESHSYEDKIAIGRSTGPAVEVMEFYNLKNVTQVTGYRRLYRQGMIRKSYE